MHSSCAHFMSTCIQWVHIAPMISVENTPVQREALFTNYLHNSHELIKFGLMIGNTNNKNSKNDSISHICLEFMTFANINLMCRRFKEFHTFDCCDYLAYLTILILCCSSNELCSISK